MKLYISDLHFYDEKSIKLDERNFADVREMNQYMINQWNATVKGGDIVVVLGDLFRTKEPDEVNYILNRLSGKICLIEGNHDNRWLKKPGINLDRFEWIKTYAEFQDGDFNIIASHYPTFCYNHQHLVNEDGSSRTYMMYGHVHNTQDELLVNQFQNITREKNIPCNMINCFCKFSDYKPLSLEQWIELDAKRRSIL